MSIINQTNNFQNSENETAQKFSNTEIKNQTNITTISNTSVAKKINKDTVSFKAHSLANYGKNWISIRDSALLLLILTFIGVNFISIHIESSKELIIILSFCVLILTFFVIYTLIYINVTVNKDFIEFKKKKYNFNEIRKIKFYNTLFNGKYIKIYLESDIYPNTTLYIDIDQMDLIEEFYLDYLKNTQNKQNKRKSKNSSLFLN